MDDPEFDAQRAKLVLRESGVNPMAMLIFCVSELDWDIAVKSDENDRDTVEGLVVGTSQFVQRYFDIADSIDDKALLKHMPISRKDTGLN